MDKPVIPPFAHRMAAALMALGLAGAAGAEEAAPLLPGGASSLQESYDDWAVTCRIVEKRKLCAVSQQQVQENGQRVLAIEVGKGDGQALSATLILPFGLLLDAGVRLKVDEKPEGEAERFRTCIPAGCLVSTSIDPTMRESLSSGKILKLAATSVDGQQAPFSISLKGFAAAIARLEALTAG